MPDREPLDLVEVSVGELQTPFGQSVLTVLPESLGEHVTPKNDSYVVWDAASEDVLHLISPSFGAGE